MGALIPTNPLKKAYLGVRLETQGNHLKVIEVAPMSPAEKGGLLAGDVILSVDRKK